MVVSMRDAIKFFGITIVCFCAVFVCTFFINYYLDVVPMQDMVNDETMPLYHAQLATAKMTCGITGGVLAMIAIIMLVFYIKIYIDSHAKELGTLKAMGYANLTISKNFLFFGLSSLVGCVLGFGLGWVFMPLVYSQMQIDGLPKIEINFHASLIVFLVIIPTVVFAVFAFCYGCFALKRPALELIKGRQPKIKYYKAKQNEKDLPFLQELSLKTLSSKKLLVFFVALASFCFSAMVQMGLSMEDLVSGTMGYLILMIGLILAVTSMFMALTSLVRANSKTMAMMKAMGYTSQECFIAVFAGYLPFIIIGFGLGTVYQFGLLYLMVNLIFKDVGEVPNYNFNVPMFFVTLAWFVVFCLLVSILYVLRIKKIAVKEVMLED